MADFKDIAGKRFGLWTAVSYAGMRGSGGYWNAVCDCGTEKSIYGGALRNGSTTSCGCATGELISKALTRHGYARGGAVAREHAIWRGMITRCTNPNRRGYEEYGGRGIAVCERWMDFANFIADMGPCPEGCSIDRYPNNDGNYEPGNCRWADAKTQASNRRPRRYFRKPA